ncbi:MAG: hypothetical protein AAFR39_11210 [Pseudomonadota bacterium]
MLVSKGTFTAGPGHEMTGGFTISRTPAGFEFATTSDFFFDGSPAPGFAYIQGDPTSATSNELGLAASTSGFLPLTQTPPPFVPRVEIKGVQSGLMHPSTPFMQFDHIFLWCFEIPSLLGYGKVEEA